MSAVSFDNKTNMAFRPHPPSFSRRRPVRLKRLSSVRRKETNVRVIALIKVKKKIKQKSYQSCPSY